MGLADPISTFITNGTAAVTGQAIQGSGNMYGWVMVRAVRGGRHADMWSDD